MRLNIQEIFSIMFQAACFIVHTSYKIRSNVNSSRWLENASRESHFLIVSFHKVGERARCHFYGEESCERADFDLKPNEVAILRS